MNEIIYACSDTGLYHQRNEDALCIFSAWISGKSVILATVCDGVGGLADGEKASRYCIQEITKWFCESLPEIMLQKRSRRRILHSMNALFEKMNETLYQKKRASTCSMCLIIGTAYYILHTGDTRIYFLGQGIRCMTKDERVEKSHILFQCLGIGGKPVFQQKCGHFHRVKLILFGSDGFYEKLTEEDLKQIYQWEYLSHETDLERCGRHLIRLARGRGESDDISVGTVLKGSIKGGKS